MQCEKFEARLHDLLDQRSAPECDPLLLEHAEQCDGCRELLSIQEQMMLGLELWEVPPPPADLPRRSVARYLHELPTAATVVERRSASIFPVWKVVSAAVAASLLIAVVTAGYLLRQSEQAPAAPVAHDVSPPPTDVRVAPEAFVDQRPVQYHRGQVAAPIGPEVLSAFDPDELLDGRRTGRMIREVTANFPEVPVNEEIPALRPITQSFSVTIGMMRKTLPGGREAPRPRNEKPQPQKPQAEYSPGDAFEGLV